MAFNFAALQPLVIDLYRNKVPKLYEEKLDLYDMLLGGQGEDVNGRGVRIPVYLSPNESNNLYGEGGSLATPGSEEFIETRVFYTRYSKGASFTGDVIDNWKTKSQIIGGITDKLSRVQNAGKKFIQRLALGNGTGQVAVAGPGSPVSGQVLTLASTTTGGSTLGARYLLKRGIYDAFTAAGVQHATAVTVTSKTGTTATFSGNIASIVAADILVPTASLNNAPHGLASIINNDTGNFQGQSRSTFPQLQANVFGAAQALPSVALVKKVKDQQKYLASEDAQDIQLLSSPSPKNLYERQAYNLVRLGQDTKFTGTMDGVGHQGSDWTEIIDMEEDTIYGYRKTHLLKFELHPFSPLNYDGQTFRLFYSNGTATENYVVWYVAKFDIGSDNPQSLFKINNISITDGPQGAAFLSY